MTEFPGGYLKKKIFAIVSIFLSLSIIFVGCQKSWPAPPDLTGIETVCLNVEMSMSETEEHWIYNDEDIERILGRLDINFVREGQDCDATLTLSGKGTPIGDNYKSESTGSTTYCYTGGTVNGKVTFSDPAQEPLVYSIIGSQPKQDSITSCYKTAPFYQIIYKQMLKAFIHIWGPQFAVVNLMDEKSYITEFLVEELENMGSEAGLALIDCLSYDNDGLVGVCARTLGSFGAEPGVVSALTKKLESDDLQTRAMVIYALQNIGPEADESIAGLILLLDDDRISDYDHVINEDAALALSLITGEQFGVDQEAWQVWYENQGD